ncbi:TPA: spermidine/putrescine ABC transporter permease [Candidatus Dependentiae bacterium]|nr:MAG: Spermidine/putrescine transport system permease protein potB [candidate division TM6 bacterium GW2011_GWF2_43_87]HBL98552.1 spermidine/putrescine ABC transporter permease [Candidatus Dependentiae bacterium]
MNLRKTFLEQIAFLFGMPAIVWQVLFVYLPLFFILFLSFRNGSFEYFVPFFTGVYIGVILRSLIFGLCTALLCLVIAFPVAYWIALCSGRWKNLLLFLLFIPFWTNFLLHIYAWMFVMDRHGIINTVLGRLGLIHEPIHFLYTSVAVFVVMVYCYTPFMVLPIYTSLEKFDVRLHEASSDLGATWWQTLWRIVVPLSLPGIRSGFFLVLVPAFGEFVIPELIGGDKVMFVGSVVAYLTLHAKTASAGAAFTILVSLVLVAVMGLVSLVMGRIGRGSVSKR